MTQTYHEMFLTSSQPSLLKKHFHPTQEQLESAKESLIQKHKMANGIQHLLFCRNEQQNETGYISANEKELIQTQKKKYLDFMRRNYSQRIPDQLSTLNKLRTRIKEFENKNETEQKRAQYQRQGRGMMQQQVLGKKRKNEAEKVTAGKKKVKVDQNEASKGKKPKDKKKQEKAAQPLKVNQREAEIQPQSVNGQDSVSESLGLDLLNSLQNQEFNAYDEQD